MKLYAHPRSGSNWAQALLERAFYGEVEWVQARTGHWSERVTVTAPGKRLRGGHAFYRAGLEGPRIYLYRDGRDVALSLWRTKAFQHRSVRGLSFAEFLRTPLDWRATPGRRARPRLTIVQHWLAHLDAWQNAPDTCFVRYERLLTDTTGELARIAEFAGMPLLETATVDAGAGPFPSGDYRVSKWRDAYDAADLNMFFESVPCDHWGLWHE